MREHWTDPLDRSIGQDGLFTIHCDADLLVQNRLENAGPARASYTQQDVSSVESIAIDVVIEEQIPAESRVQSQVQNNLTFASLDIQVQLHRPEEKVETAVCLSPAFYKKMPLLRWLEWREHLRRLGNFRVNWYGRDARMEDFVNVYNRLSGAKDIFR